MTSTVFHYALSALAASVLITVAASGAVAGETMRVQHMHDELLSGLKGHATNNSTTSEGLATNKPSQQGTTSHYEFRWWQDYSSR